MKHTHFKNALLGVAIAIVATYSFPAVLFTLMIGPRALMVLFSPLPLRGLLMTFWMVIPLGAALGMLIPRIAAGKNRCTAALHGAGYGAIAGLAVMLCFTSVFTSWMAPGQLWFAVVVYCAVWVGAYACIRAKSPVLHR